MIPRLASPSVCVIDDDVDESTPILAALLKLGIGAVHIAGDSMESLPPSPFECLRIVFTDLYLSGSSGKTAATHTASVFRRVVSTDTAPVLVVIWSKHISERIDDEGIPRGDQPTAVDSFKDALFESYPGYRDRLIFAEMVKPGTGQRPEDDEWIRLLQADIETTLAGFPACDLIWMWESLVRKASSAVSGELTALVSVTEVEGAGEAERAVLLDKGMRDVFRHLAKAQGGPDCSPASASGHLFSVLSQCLTDHLERADKPNDLGKHGSWLCQPDEGPPRGSEVGKLNALLLTAEAAPGGAAFTPGTVYTVEEHGYFENSFGVPRHEFIGSFRRQDCREVAAEEWMAQVSPVAIEISPACDFHARKRVQALMLCGVLVPSRWRKAAIKRNDSIEATPDFTLRWAVGDFSEQETFLIFNSRHKMTFTDTREPDWLRPRFRLRELPTAYLRNWHASQAARVGYLSLRAVP